MSWILAASPNDIPCSTECIAPTLGDCIRDGRQCLGKLIDVAALYVQAGGAYYGAHSVDPWDESRDARNYDGPWPVVAHPPCARWCKPLAKVNQTRYGHKIGDDGGCFQRALAAVIAFGGVLEHPANSYAWDKEYFDLLKPERGTWKMRFSYGRYYWVTEVSQSAYGHKARKKTWLLYCSPYHFEPPAVDWSDPKGTHLTSWLQRTSRKAPRITKREADKTPPAFRDLLISLATISKVGTAPSVESKPQDQPRPTTLLCFAAQREVAK